MSTLIVMKQSGQAVYPVPLKMKIKLELQNMAQLILGVLKIYTERD